MAYLDIDGPYIYNTIDNIYNTIDMVTDSLS